MRKIYQFCGLATLLFCLRSSAAETPHLILFLTDFGVIDHAVAVCKGVMLSVDPLSRIVDISHQVKPYDISEGARILGNSTPYFPEGAVFVSVIDPEVGSARKAIVVKSKKNQYFVLPDNGLITYVANQDGIQEIREIKNTSWFLKPQTSSTFHGRDIFSPVGAHLARGDDWKNVGPVIEMPVRLPINPFTVDKKEIRGQGVAFAGPFGNVITNIPYSQIEKAGKKMGDKLIVRLGSQKIPVAVSRMFASVGKGKALLYSDSNEWVAFAVNQGNFAEAYRITLPVGVSIPISTGD